MPVIASKIHAIGGKLKLRLWIALILLLMAPVMALSDPVTKCLQRELRAAGHNPRGIDGIIGPNTRAAAAAWAQKTEADLPDLDDASATQWCSAILTARGSVPEAATGTERYCIWFQDVLSGVWLDPNGKPSLRFRYASEDDGAGCYAWLNPVKNWMIAEPGTQILRVERQGNLWSSGDEENGIFVDTEARSARYVQNGVTSFGVLTDLPNAPPD